MALTKSQQETLKRQRHYYPPEYLIDQFDEFTEKTGESQSGLVTKLVASFLREYKATGEYPKVVTLHH